MNEEPIKFYNLAPIKDADINIYTEVLDYSLENNDVKNVVITGIYGAGKSSLIESYKEKKKINLFIYLWLILIKCCGNYIM